MAKIGIIVPSASGHLNPSLSLGRTLKDRGHHVIVFAAIDERTKVDKSGLEYCAIGKERYPEGEYRKKIQTLGEATGKNLLRKTLTLIKEWTETLIEDLPRYIEELGIDLMIVDECSPAAPSCCEHAGIPFVMISNAAVVKYDPAVPLFHSHDGPITTFYGRMWNRFHFAIMNFLISRPLLLKVNEARRKWNLPLLKYLDDETGQGLHIAQEPEFFTFPRRQPPKNLHFLGPFHDSRRGEIDSFPWGKLNGKPLVYASMGTISIQMSDVLRTIAKACENLDVQLVISLGGGGLHAEKVGSLAGDAILVDYAPQLELLDRAAACVTHAGLNTTLECLARGVPMVALPVGNDQPGVAARIKRCGAGISLRTSTPSLAALRDAIEKIVFQPEWKERAETLAKMIDPEVSRRKACELIEEELTKQAPRKT